MGDECSQEEELKSSAGCSPNPSPIVPWTLRCHCVNHGYFLPTGLFKNLLLLQLCSCLLLPNLLLLSAILAEAAIPMGRVHRPEAFSSSSKMVMMGTSFCLLSSEDTKLLSSWIEHGQHGE